MGAGDGVAIMARNHRGFIDATLAVSKLGAHGLYMNTAFSGPQLVDVMEREGPEILIYDAEFSELLGEAKEGAKRFVSWRDEGETGADRTTDELIESGGDSDLSPPAETGRFVILTSGTTGTPKGAQRAAPDTLSPLAAMFSRIPMRAGETTVIAAPLFHSWGFAHFVLGLSLSSTYVLQRKFDPEETLKAISEHEATALVVVPVMMQRILQLPEETLAKYDLPSLRVTAASGSALPGRAGDEVDGPLRRQPLQPLRLDRGRLGDDRDARGPARRARDRRAAAARNRRQDRRQGGQGRGTAGRDRTRLRRQRDGLRGLHRRRAARTAYEGLLSSGDVGHFDAEGRLFIDGRDDEMIVSGGENVFPREVEDLLADHDAVKEAAVIGVDDDEFGQRLKAFVVLGDGESVDEDEIKGYVKKNLARYKVPREVEFLDSLPRNATGKVLKRELT